MINIVIGLVVNRTNLLTNEPWLELFQFLHVLDGLWDGPDLVCINHENVTLVIAWFCQHTCMKETAMTALPMTSLAMLNLFLSASTLVPTFNLKCR